MKLLNCRSWFLAVALVSAAAGASDDRARPAPRALPDARDFQADARESRAQRTPILVFYTAADCPYCAIVREDYLEPMFNGREYRDRLLFRTVHVDSDDAVRDFGGRARTHAEFAQAQGVRLTPYIKFYDASGRELVPGLLGLTTRDFFGGYLEQAIADAIGKLRPVTAPAR